MRFLNAGLLLFALFILTASSASAEMKIGGTFSDHMVLQCNEPVRVYGTAKPGDAVGVKLDDKKALAIANEKGEWQATLQALPPGGPHQMTVVCEDKKIVFSDVMVGEVWLCSGQSNMLLNLLQAGLEQEAANTPTSGMLRVLTVPFDVDSKPSRQLTNGQWEVLTDKNAAKCAAIPYFFARDVNKKLNVPVGVIVSAAAGSPVQSWISAGALNKIPQGRSMLTEFVPQYAAFSKYLEAKAKAATSTSELESWNNEAKVAMEYGKAAISIPPCTSLYNGMIAPLVPYTVRGILWYQGEVNVYAPDNYEKLFTTLIHDWRKKWSKPHMPFLFVQIAPMGDREKLPNIQSKIARLREAQSRVSQLPWTYMTTAVDTVDQESADLHASNKRLIGKRLAQIALTTQYNKPYPFKGPTMESATAEEDGKVRIRFRNVGNGLTKKGDMLKGFAIAGDDKKLIWARGEIEGDSVVIWHQLVKKPALVTYSYADNPDGNLYNGDNLPAIPFRSAVSRTDSLTMSGIKDGGH